jgi:hypothetical protein
VTARAGAQGRETVQRLLPDVSRALAAARAIANPWYRCQALTMVAAHAERDALQLLEEATKAADDLTEPNRRLCCMAWPMSLLAEMDPRAAAAHIPALLGIAAQEAHTLRRADGLLHLFEAVYPDSRLRSAVWPSLLEALATSRGSRALRLARFAYLVVAPDDPQKAAQLVTVLGDSREGRQAKREAAAGQWLGPHGFVPYYQKPRSSPRMR